MSPDLSSGRWQRQHRDIGVCMPFGKMEHLAPVLDTVMGEQATRLFVDRVFQHHGLSETIVSDRDPRFTAAFWKTLFHLLGTKLSMTTADLPQTDGQTEHVNRVLEDTLPQDRQKEYSDRNGRRQLNVFNVGDLVLLDTRNLPLDMISSMGNNKLKHCFIGPFAVLGRHGSTYIIDLPKLMKTHSTYYLGLIKRYHNPQGQSAPDDPSQGQEEVIEPLQNETESQTPSGVPRKPVQARGRRVGSPAGRMTKMRAV
ncbi:unnamed protein product [Phytophthora fragariaefolia]|uniref:Unnamed protein product n=1 Tax=Phytophthora fragariaefolia TaxID=1490495 RepID=A0A9W7D0F1_9STRA|nr:unnamed protein product [Phytophthora fragariaefolia]